MESYIVYLYDLPKVSEDQKSVIPTQESRTQEFTSPVEAKAFAASNAAKFGRVILMRSADGEQKVLERYTDGKLERPAASQTTA